MVITKDQPLGPGQSVLKFIVAKCEDHSAIQVPPSKCKLIVLGISHSPVHIKHVLYRE